MMHKCPRAPREPFYPEVERISMDERGQQIASFSDAVSLLKDAAPILGGVWKWMK
jgi:hypothetical protein